MLNHGIRSCGHGVRGDHDIRDVHGDHNHGGNNRSLGIHSCDIRMMAQQNVCRYHDVRIHVHIHVRNHGRNHDRNHVRIRIRGRDDVHILHIRVHGHNILLKPLHQQQQLVQQQPHVCRYHVRVHIHVHNHGRIRDRNHGHNHVHVRIHDHNRIHAQDGVHGDHIHDHNHGMKQRRNPQEPKVPTNCSC